MRAVDDLALWYDEPAGSDWLRALPVGAGRLGAMVFGNVGTERLQLNEDTLWAGGPCDPANPGGADALPQIRQLVFDGQWEQAQSLIDRTMLGRPAGELAYQPVGDLTLTLPGSGATSGYRRWLDLTTATTAVTYVVNGVRFHRQVIASAPGGLHRHRLPERGRRPRGLRGRGARAARAGPDRVRRPVRTHVPCARPGIAASRGRGVNARSPARGRGSVLFSPVRGYLCR